MEGLPKATTNFADCQVIRREGRQVTFGQVVVLTETGVVFLDEITIEYPADDQFSITNKRVSDEGVITYTASCLSPRVVSFKVHE